MTIKRRKILIIVFTIILLFFIHSAAGGSFGLRPMTHGCLGFEIIRNKAVKFFPEGDIEFKVLFHFRYFNPSELENLNAVFCLGQDIWFGE